MHILNRAAILKAAKLKGFDSLGELARKMGRHRNSISGYLGGKPILPNVVEELLDALGLTVEEATVNVRSSKTSGLQRELLPILESLVKEFPTLSFSLFGSRAKGKARKYSDVDLGVISPKSLPLPLEHWSKIRNLVDNLSEDLPYQIDVIDLGRCDGAFKNEIRSDIIFLGGNPRGFEEFIQ